MDDKQVDREYEGEPWERQSWETNKAFDAFQFYRDTPAHARGIGRCLPGYYGKLSGKLRESKQRIWEGWSSKYHWQERVKLWDDEQRRIQAEQRRKEIEEMNKRHLLVARALQAKAAERLKKLKPEELSPADLRTYIREAIALERLALGEAESVHGLRLELGQLAKMSDDELLAILQS